jgi:hypothetical protein
MNAHTSTRRALLGVPVATALARVGDMAAIAATTAPLAATARAASASVETRSLAGFDEVAWDAVGELSIEQTGREHLRIEAEPDVLRRIVARVRGRRLEIAIAPGGVESRLPIRFRLELDHLRRLDLRGAGHAATGALRVDELRLDLGGSVDLRVASLQARRLDLMHAGAGDVSIAGGRVEAQQVTLDGSGAIDLSALEAREADALLAGSGRISLAAAQRLGARIDGSGDIVYRGRPQLTQVVRGAGEVRHATTP